MHPLVSCVDRKDVMSNGSGITGLPTDLNFLLASGVIFPKLLL